jgi:hypothetical protein
MIMRVPIIMMALFLSFSFSFSCSVMAQEDEEFEDQKQVVLSGYIKTDNRIRVEGDNEYSYHEYRVSLKTEAKPNENLHIYSEMWLRSFGVSDASTSSDLSENDKVSPWDLDFREAYIDVYGFISEDMDLRIGKQRIAWGTGDNLNPTDNLNPDDLEDIWDFGRHLGSDALKLTYYFESITFESVFIPLFTPAVMPKSSRWNAALAPSMEAPAGITFGTITNTIIKPENNLKESLIMGFKTMANIMDFDFSLSYVSGRDDIPLMNKITLAAPDSSGDVDVALEFIYPRIHVVGLDMAGSIGDMGLWVEIATFYPERVIMVTDLSALGMPNQETLVLDDEKPYSKYVLGVDYTFENGIYVNTQYLHGFIHERGAENLEDYILMGLEYKMLNDKLKIIPIQGGVEIKDQDDIDENFALIYSPAISYYPYDNIEFTTGCNVIDGYDTTTFGKVEDLDEVFFKVKGSF